MMLSPLKALHLGYVLQLVACREQDKFSDFFRFPKRAHGGVGICDIVPNNLSLRFQTKRTLYDPNADINDDEIINI